MRVISTFWLHLNPALYTSHAYNPYKSPLMVQEPVIRQSASPRGEPAYHYYFTKTHSIKPILMIYHYIHRLMNPSIIAREASIFSR